MEATMKTPECSAPVIQLFLPAGNVKEEPGLDLDWTVDIPHSASASPDHEACPANVKTETDQGIIKDVGAPDDSSVGSDDQPPVCPLLLTCYHCSLTLQKKSQLRKHIASLHIPHIVGIQSLKCEKELVGKVKEEVLHRCTSCEFTSKWPQSVKRHILIKHTGLKPQFCPYCEFSTSHPGNLKFHVIARHIGDLPCRCTFCDYRAIHLGAIKRHIVSKHTRERAYPCSECSYQGLHLANLKSHIRARHTKERLYPCKECDYRAINKSALKSHVMTRHTNEKPYLCTLCDYKASIPGTLRRHFKTKHTGERPYACPHCTFATADPSHFKRHLTSKHSNGTKPLSGQSK